MFRRFLLAAAVASAPSIFSPAAFAQMQVETGGYTAFQAGFFDNDQANGTYRDFQSEAEIFLRASGQAANGLEYGAKIELQTSTSDSANADEAGIFLEGGWGRLELGDDDGANELSVSAPRVGIGQINGSLDDFIPASDRGHALNNRGSAAFLPYDSDDATKITYYTPVWKGLQAGVSYAPEAQVGADGETVTFLKTDRLVRNFVETGVRYRGEVGPVGLTVTGEYNFADNESATREGVRSWGLGTQLSWQEFKMGGGYNRDGDTLGDRAAGADDVTSWNIGATWERAPWGLGLGYLQVGFDDNGGGLSGQAGDGNGGTFSLLAGGVAYTVAPGLTTGADLGFYQRNRRTGADSDGWMLVGDVTAAF